MKKQSNRLNDTAALVGNAPSMSTNETFSVSIRKIDNGYIVSTSQCNGMAGYHSSEKFVSQKPKLGSLVDEDDEEVGPDKGALSRAKTFLQKDPDDSLVNVRINGKGA